MEARKITIVATREQKKYVITSGAETLGQLKNDLNEARIDYSDMTFMEGLTRTEMKDDNSVLPTNVKRTNRETGEETTTNELVFMLTNTQKKIRSGAIAHMTRTEAYAAIKANGLAGACVAKYGKNFTQCSTENLLVLIAENVSTPSAATPNECKELANHESMPADSADSKCMDIDARVAIKELVAILVKNDYLDDYERDSVLDFIRGGASACKPTSTSESPYSDNEIDDMFRGM